MDSAESHARRALARFRRALEKAQRELESLTGALETAEGEDFPHEEYARALDALEQAIEFTEEEARRLQEKILHAGGLEPGRVKRG